jgi:hypothetical protein
MSQEIDLLRFRTRRRGLNTLQVFEK